MPSRRARCSGVSWTGDISEHQECGEIQNPPEHHESATHRKRVSCKQFGLWTGHTHDIGYVRLSETTPYAGLYSGVVLTGRAFVMKRHLISDPSSRGFTMYQLPVGRSWLSSGLRCGLVGLISSCGLMLCKHDMTSVRLFADQGTLPT